jgi:hypothetical protein
MSEDPQAANDAVPQAAPTDRWWEGDASADLEELVIEPLAPLAGSAAGLGATALIELVGPHLRLAGTLLIGHHRRVSDFRQPPRGAHGIARRDRPPPERRSDRPRASGSAPPKSR